MITNSRFERRLSCLRLLIFGVVFGLLSVSSVFAAPANPVIVGNARFMVITPTCVRIEYASYAHFVDAPSLFAADRKTRFAGFRAGRNGASTVIDTGVIRLTYTPDGKDFSSSNLNAVIRRNGMTTHWAPGAPNPGNLGGTIRTLDGVAGPVDLGQGLLSRDGWFLLDDSQTPVLTKSWVQSRPAESGTDWYLFGYGHDYRSALKSLAAIGGVVPLPRKYALGAWYSRYWPYSSSDYRQIIGEYAAHDFPLDNIVLDMDWHEDGWTGWSWNRKLLPDAELLLAWFHTQGLHVTLNLHPADGVAPHEDQYAAFMKAMGADPASQQTIPFDAGDPKYMAALSQTILNPLLDEGVDFWWLDWQQYPNTLSIPDLTNLFWLNTLLYQDTSRNGLRGMSFSRWAGWGDHRHPIHFSGDANSGWLMLQFEVPFTSTAGNVGCFFWSHDIGGHNGGRNEESYTRWVQFGATSPVLRSHSTRAADMDRRPWTYPKWAEDSMRVSFHLRSQLFPYIYSSAWQSCRDTIPLDRPLYLDYGNDERAYHNAQEFLLGDNLLVAPIVSPGVGPKRVARQTVWFPKGDTWYNNFTGERYAGGSEALVAADINEFPLYVRGGVPIPMQPYRPRMATTPLTQLVVRCFPGEDGRTGNDTLYEDDGQSTQYQQGQFATTSLSYTRRGSVVTVTVGAAKGKYRGQPASRAITVELPDTGHAIKSVVNGHPVSITYDARTLTNRVTLPARPIGQAVTVVVQTVPVDLTILHTRAAARRMAGVVGHLLAGRTVKQILATALAADKSPSDQEIILASAGIGFVRKNVGAYLYHGTLQNYVFAPSGLLDSNAAIVHGPQGDQRLTASSAPRLTGDSLQAWGTFTVSGLTVQQPMLSELLNVANIALSATVTVSGIEDGYGKAGATDGIVGGYPDDGSQEWSSGGTVGAWIQLDWPTPQTIDRIVLYDRPNLTDQVTGGTLTFSDGSTLPVDALPNDAKDGRVIRFPAKTVTWVKFTITAVKPDTKSAGLAEIAVFRAGK